MSSVLLEARCLSCGVKWSERVVPESKASTFYEGIAETHTEANERHEVIVTSTPIVFHKKGKKVIE